MYNNFHQSDYSDGSWPTFALERERVPRKVNLKKGSSGLGFNIIGGEDNEGIFVSFLLAGGAADLSGQIRRGDQLLFVNGHDLQHSSHSEAVAVLKQSGEIVEIICQHRPEEYFRFEARRQLIQEQVMDIQQNSGTLKTTQKRTFYIRTLFDYDPRHDSGLPSRGISFQLGDILQVTNASDDEWWQARKLTGDIPEDGLGIIPGRKRVERRERSRMKNVKFVGKDSESTGGAPTTERKKRQLFGRRLLFTRTKDRIRSDSSVLTSEQSRVLDKGSPEESVVLSYEAVTRQELKYVRPVIIAGPLAERFIEDLVTDLPDKFVISLTHTSRPRRDHEVDGQEHRFMSSPRRQQVDSDVVQENDAGSGGDLLNDHFSGTNIEAVRDIAEMGKHSLLTMSGNAVKKLQTHGFYPIVIFIKPTCIESIMEWNKRMPADQARTAFEQAIKQEKDFKQHFTAIVTGDAVDDLYTKVKDVIQHHSIPIAWIPSKEKL